MTEMYRQVMGIGEPLSALQLIFSHGFILFMILTWTPIIIISSILLYLKNKRNKEVVQEKKERLVERVRDVA